MHHLPSQFLRAGIDDAWTERRSLEEAARSLCMAVFVRALRDLLNNQCSCKRRCTCSEKRRRHYQDAHDWINGALEETEVVEGELTVEGPLTQQEAMITLTVLDRCWSFDNVCSILGWDSEWIRERVPFLSPADVSRLEVL